VVGPGTYGSPGAGLDITLNAGETVVMHGQAGQPMPTIYTYVIANVNDGNATLRDLRLEGMTGANSAIWLISGTFDRVFVRRHQPHRLELPQRERGHQRRDRHDGHP
jgi:hypothetical protein